MKENRIELLIELLNQYQKENGYSEDNGYEYRYIDEDGISYKPADKDCEVFSIDFNFWRKFIKRLVDNDKIDFDIVKADTTRPIRDNMNKYTLEDYTRYERVLMLLAIQEQPIDFLVSILK